MTNEGSDANFTELIDDIYHAPEQSALEFTSETIAIAPELGTIIVVGFVMIMLLFVIAVIIGIILNWKKIGTTVEGFFKK